MAITGDLKDFSFPNLLNLLGVRKKTGELTVSSTDGLYHVWFYEGKIVAALSPKQHGSFFDLLVSQASSSNSAERVEYLSKLYCKIDEPVGLCLQREGLISLSGLTKIFRQQMEIAIYPLFWEPEGRFKFVNCATLPYAQMTGISQDGAKVAIEGVRLSIGQSDQVKSLPGKDCRFFKIVEELSMLQLSILECNVWEKISPSLTLEEISTVLKENVGDVQRVCSQFLSSGLIERYTASDLSSLASPSSIKNLSTSVNHSTSSNSQTRDGARNRGGASRPSVSLLSRLTSALKAIRT